MTSASEIIAGWNVVDAPDEAAWKLARHRLLTASDVAGVLGLDSYKSRNRVLAAKREAEPPSVYVSSAMRGGQFLESGVFAWYLDDVRRHSAELGTPPPEGNTCRLPGGTSMLVRHSDQLLGASPDGLVVDSGVASLVEVKLTNPARWADSWGPAAMRIPRAWSRISDVMPPSYGRCPLRHWIQLQTQMLCTGVPLGVIVGCCGTERLDFHFGADAHIQGVIISETQRFWEECHAD